MQKINSPALTIIAIFGSAFVLAAMGCGASSSTKSSPTAEISTTDKSKTPPTSLQTVKELTPAQITRDCSEAEFTKLKAWRSLLNESNIAIDNLKGKKDPSTIESAIAAVKACDAVIEHHAVQPCRKVLVTETKYYDQSRLLKDCKKSTDYLVKYDVRPVKNTGSVVSQPAEPKPNTGGGTAPAPQKPPVHHPPDAGAVISAGEFKQCTTDEFAKLVEYSSAQSKADVSIKNLGPIANWKYDANAISNAAITTKSCENLIKYHTQNPCQKTVVQTDGSKQIKQYTADSLKARCQMARTYFYEYVQNTTTLIFPNAELYLDFSPLSPKIFEPGFKDQVSGNCVVENNTAGVIDYSNQQALIVDTRFHTAQVVFETAEGLTISCYGLNIDGPFSKRQIVKVLKEEQSDIRLSYKLK